MNSAIALISTVSIAIGVVVTALTKGMNTDVYSYMFGSILAMSESDVYMSIALSVVVIILFVFSIIKYLQLHLTNHLQKRQVQEQMHII